METPTAKRPAIIEELLVHADWLRRLAGRLVDESDADDLVQETWIAALRSPPQRAQRAPGSARPWLAQVLRNLVRSRFRARRVRAVAAPELTAIAAADERDPSRGPDELLQRATLERDLATLVLQLDEPFRTTILLRYREGRTAADIARHSGVPAGTVRYRLHEGIARLRARLDNRHAGEGGRARWRALLAPLAAAAPKLPAPQALADAALAPLRRPLGVAASFTLVVAILGALAWWWGGGTEPSGQAGPGAEAQRAWRWAGSLSPGTRTAAATVTGFVMDAGGRPVPGAWVSLSRAVSPIQEPRDAAAAGAGGDGGFRFGELAPGEYLLTATDARPDSSAAAVFSAAFPLRSGQIETVTLVLSRAGVALEGQVLDVGGGPVPGARVTASSGIRSPGPGPRAGSRRRRGARGGFAWCSSRASTPSVPRPRVMRRSRSPCR